MRTTSVTAVRWWGPLPARGAVRLPAVRFVAIRFAGAMTRGSTRGEV